MRAAGAELVREAAAAAVLLRLEDAGGLLAAAAADARQHHRHAWTLAEWGSVLAGCGEQWLLHRCAVLRETGEEKAMLALRLVALVRTPFWRVSRDHCT